MMPVTSSPPTKDVRDPLVAVCERRRPRPQRGLGDLVVAGDQAGGRVAVAHERLARVAGFSGRDHAADRAQSRLYLSMSSVNSSIVCGVRVGRVSPMAAM